MTIFQQKQSLNLSTKYIIDSFKYKRDEMFISEALRFRNDVMQAINTGSQKAFFIQNAEIIKKFLRNEKYSTQPDFQEITAILQKILAKPQNLRPQEHQQIIQIVLLMAQENRVWQLLMTPKVLTYVGIYLQTLFLFSKEGRFIQCKLTISQVLKFIKLMIKRPGKATTVQKYLLSQFFLRLFSVFRLNFQQTNCLINFLTIMKFIAKSPIRLQKAEMLMVSLFYHLDMAENLQQRQYFIKIMYLLLKNNATITPSKDRLKSIFKFILQYMDQAGMQEHRNNSVLSCILILVKKNRHAQRYCRRFLADHLLKYFRLFPGKVTSIISRITTRGIIPRNVFDSFFAELMQSGERQALECCYNLLNTLSEEDFRHQIWNCQLISNLDLCYISSPNLINRILDVLEKILKKSKQKLHYWYVHDEFLALQLVLNHEKLEETLKQRIKKLIDNMDN